jgi:hypothetical protein
MHGNDILFITEAELTWLERTPDGLSERQRLAAPLPDVGFASRPTYFDAPGVAFDGRTLIVSAPLADVSDETPVSECEAPCKHDQGAVFVYDFERDVGFSLLQTLVVGADGEGLEFGSATSLAGDWLAVGAPKHGAAGTESGAVYLFQRNGKTFEPWATVQSSARRVYDYFGDSVLWHDDLLLVGAPGHDGAADLGAADLSVGDDSAPDSGGVFAFLLGASELKQVGVFKPSAELMSEYPFPDQLRLSGNRLLVPSNTATVKSDATELPFAGKVFEFR